MAHAAHLLSRAGFGGSPAEIEALYARGLKGAVAFVLEGEEDADLFPPPDMTQPPEIESFRRTVQAETDPIAKQELLTQQRKLNRAEMQDLRDWWMQRMRYSLWPLREKMTLFWHGHFATSVEKTRLPYLMWQQNETLRANALGNFRTLTKAVSRDPAMMQYLDLQRSVKNQPNENFARELMELFTLGEGVRYTESDIREAARALTGYRINPRTQQFVFARRQYDDSAKTFLGETGNLDGDEVIDVILQQPECGQFITRKLWRFFVSDEPSEEVVQALGQQLTQSNYDISGLLRKVFLSREFYSREVIRSQVKSPAQWIVQTAKVLECPLPPAQLTENAMNQMGQILFAPPNVKGWDGGRAWITSATLLYRFNLAGQLVRAQGSPAKINLQKIAPATLRADEENLCEVLAGRLLNAPLPASEKGRLLAFLAERGTTMDDSTIRDLLHLIMSTPDYQLT